DVYNSDFRLSTEQVATTFRALEEACRDVGRDPATIGRTAALRVALTDTKQATGGQPEDGTLPTEVFRISRGLSREAVKGTPEELAGLIRAFQAGGVEHLTLYVVDPPDSRGVERFGRVIELLQ